MRDDSEMLEAFCHGMAEIVNLFGSTVEPELLADALISAGVEVLRKDIGPAAAARRLELAAEIVIDRYTPRH